MSSGEDGVQFTETDHAMLFGWMARAVIQRVGEEKGEVVVRQAVRRYGEQRGRRMALRAEANGHPRSMTNYIVYGEWAASEPCLLYTSDAADDTQFVLISVVGV